MLKAKPCRPMPASIFMTARDVARFCAPSPVIAVFSALMAPSPARQSSYMVAARTEVVADIATRLPARSRDNTRLVTADPVQIKAVVAGFHRHLAKGLPAGNGKGA